MYLLYKLYELPHLRTDSFQLRASNIAIWKNILNGSDKMLILSLALGVVLARHGGRKHLQMDRPRYEKCTAAIYEIFHPSRVHVKAGVGIGTPKIRISGSGLEKWRD